MWAITLIYNETYEKVRGNLIMNKKCGEFIIRGVIVALVGIGAVSVYWSYSKPIVETKKPVIVSSDMSNIGSKEEDKPLQVVKKEKTDAIEGLNFVIGLTGDNEVIGQIGLTRKEIEEKYKKYDKSTKSEEIKFLKDIGGSAYKINLSTLEKTTFKIGEQSVNNHDICVKISPDGTKLGYCLMNFNNNCERTDYYIYDIKNNTNKKVFAKDEWYQYPTWSRDSKYIIGAGRDKNILIYDIQNDNIKRVKVKIDTKEVMPNPAGKFYTEDGKTIYFDGMQNDINTKNSENTLRKGIYKLSADNGEIESLMLLSDNYNAKNIDNYIINGGFEVIDKGKKVVFEGNLNGQKGLYIYNVASKKYNKVAESIGGVLVPFWVSPDESKVIYATFEDKGKNGCWSVYAAKIKDNELVNKILLCSDVEHLDGRQENTVWWSNDSKKVVISEIKGINLDNRDFGEKGYINTIYFK